uniref:Uncharacterized protein LOC102810371 n=1 Tax=Saccoglossus kowalevskii TaxID=10224 RepID=A0ABM0MWQ3_SACKO|nr:PREDICTED: uncharacterized protein LOC102810371 [Saccoglossus kowalevskii]
MRIAGAEVRAGNYGNFTENNLCGVITSSMVNENSVFNVSCIVYGHPVRAQYVSLHIKGIESSLSICEVEIFSNDVDGNLDAGGGSVNVNDNSEDGIGLDDGDTGVATPDTPDDNMGNVDTENNITVTSTGEEHSGPAEPVCTVPADLGNVAFEKPATQSSRRAGASAGRAVDGNRHSDFKMKSCAMTLYEYEPWWQVDLRQEFSVFQVSITNRQDCCAQRLENAEVRVGNDGNILQNAVCGSILSGAIVAQEYIQIICACGAPIPGRYVTVQLVAKQEELTLCEVEVFGRPVPLEQSGGGGGEVGYDWMPTPFPMYPGYWRGRGNYSCDVPEDLIDIAQGMPVQQSSVFGRADAKRAVDGNRNSDFAGNSCTRTEKESNPWWFVDLKQSQPVYVVRITNRMDCCSFRLQGLEVRIGDSRNFTQNDRCGVKPIPFRTAKNETITIKCKCQRPLIGRFVSLHINDDARTLTLCEVEVLTREDEVLPTLSWLTTKPAPGTTEPSCLPPEGLLNVAMMNLAVTQSSVKADGTPDKAIDGNTNGNYSEGSCTRTEYETSPWWLLDFGVSADIYQVSISNRIDCCSYRLKGASVHIGDNMNISANPKCGDTIYGAAMQDSTIQLICNCGLPLSGRYVGIHIQDKEQTLTLCEVEVWALEEVVPPTIPPIITTQTPCDVYPDDLVNVATGRPAMQSSTESFGNAGNAVDGNKNNSFSMKSCTKTKAENEPWWTVDLRKTREVFHVTITNRYDCCSFRLRGAEIRIGDSRNITANTRCGKYITSEEAQTETIDVICNCGEPISGRFVSIHHINKTQILSLCEVEVWATGPSHFTTLVPFTTVTTETLCDAVPDDLENVAIGRPVMQSSTVSFGKATNAVDGNTNSNFSKESCTKTQKEFEPWWVVDLRRTREVFHVTISNRFDCCSFRLRGAEIRIGDSRNITANTRCGKYITSEDAQKETIDVICNCGEPISGRFVSIQLTNKTQPLSLCEVEVWAVGPSHFTTLVPPTLATTEISCIVPDGLINVATLKQARQSSYQRDADADRAVDGNHDSHFLGRSCTMTDREQNPWWLVDLSASRDIYHVTITNRVDCCSFRLRGAEIRIGDSEVLSENSKCGDKVTSESAQKEVIDVICNCGKPISGSIVSIHIEDRTQILTLCEVDVWVSGSVTTDAPKLTTVPPCISPTGLVNIAIGRPVRQSSTDWPAVAERAVDGNKNSNYSGKSCSSTTDEFAPWWQLDLGKSRDVYHVTITNRYDCCSKRLQSSEIRVGDYLNYTHNAVCGGKGISFKEAKNETIDITCGCHEPIRGRYIGISSIRTTMLTLCEVEVWTDPVDNDLHTTLPPPWTGLATTTSGPITTTPSPCVLPDVLLNIARGEPTTQSSVHGMGRPGKAVDGNSNSNSHEGRSCTQTEKEMAPYWMVDLGRPRSVFKITLTNRMDCCSYRLKNAEIRVGDSANITDNTVCGDRISEEDAKLETTDHICGCGYPIIGRYVSVQIVDMPDPRVLTLCEVEVFGVFEATTTPAPTTAFGEYDLVTA